MTTKININGDIHDEAFIGANSSLVAPLTIGKKSFVGAGSVISKIVRKKNSSSKHFKRYRSYSENLLQ